MNPFLGQTQTQLEIWLREAQEALATGRTPQSINAGDFGSTDFVQGNAEYRISQLLEALNLLAPETYPSSLTRRVTRTKIKVAADTDGFYL